MEPDQPDKPGRDAAITSHEVIGGNPDHLEALLALYAGLMPSYTHYIPRMRRRALRPANEDPRFVEHYLLFEVDGTPAAMTTFKYVPARRCGIGIDLGADRAYRDLVVGGQRLAAHVIATILATIEADARAAGHPPPMGLFVEVSTPRLVERYREYGFVDLALDYAEPVFPDDAEVTDGPADPAHMVFKPAQVGVFPVTGGGFDPADAEAVSQFIRAFLVDHYGLPETHWAVQRAVQSITAAAG